MFPAEAAITRLTRPANDAAGADDLLREAKQSINRALDLTGSISRYTKLESEFTPEPVVLSRAISDVLTDYRPLLDEKRIQTEVKCPENATVVSNRYQLGIVLTNLLLNSVDAMAGRADPLLTILADVNDAKVSLAVHDNGGGIEANDLPHVFETFFSTKPNHGTGLGLATVKKIVELYGGRISVASQRQRGTTFTLEFTRADGSGSTTDPLAMDEDDR